MRWPWACRPCMRVADVPEAAQVVAVDDVALLDDAAQIALFALYNRQRESGGMLLVSGTAAPAHLTLRDDLRTRLGWGLVYQVQALSDEEKALALQQHAQARGFILTPEVTQYLLRHGRRDLPALLSVLDALDEHCLRLQRGCIGAAAERSDADGEAGLNDKKLVGAQISAYVVWALAHYPQRGQEPLRGNLGVPLAGAARFLK